MNQNQRDIPIFSCIKSTEYSIHTRRCFITGEYCSQQTNIQKERHRLHEKDAINAFVIMNFSSVSDVVYETRMIPFIEDLSKLFFLDKKGKRIACVSSGKKAVLPEGESENSPWSKVEQIYVHRADSNPVSNYVICNRICQQMQMADLIIVDVSVVSANVFYELGLATAFQKLILPICFSNSFYDTKLPAELTEAMAQQRNKFARKGNTNRPTTKELEAHIDCFPWRRTLFEHFGIRYQSDDDQVQYLKFDKAASDNFGFSDRHYDRFPYTEKRRAQEKTVGQTIYDWLQKSYNPKKGIPASYYNTVILYTMGGFLNEDEAGRCIVNFYNNITKPIREEFCFCGDRVAVLGQPNIIWDDPKDAQSIPSPHYSVSDLIRNSIDQATNLAERKRIKTGDYLPSMSEDEIQEESKKIINRRVKSHIRNRSIPLNLDNPVYVTQYKSGLQKDLDEVFNKNNTDNENKYPFTCLYHVVLHTLRYANEIVVDLSSNSIQALFWLGAAHGSNIYAVTVRHETTVQEQSWAKTGSTPHDRPIFDVGGLWTAMLRHGETESFNKQLELIQQGIDQHARLKLPETALEEYEYEVIRQLHHASPYLKYGAENFCAEGNTRIKEIHTQLAKKNRAESLALESYYRDRFWRQLLRANQLHLFLPLNDTNDKRGPRLQVIKWDVDTVAELSHYLSKRKVISQYQFDMLRDDECYSGDAKKENFIVIGGNIKPIRNDGHHLSLAEWLNKTHGQSVCQMRRWTMKCGNILASNRGFLSVSGQSESYGTQYLNHKCNLCPNSLVSSDSPCYKNSHKITCIEQSHPQDIEKFQQDWEEFLNKLPEKLTLCKKETKEGVFYHFIDGNTKTPINIPIQGGYFYFEREPSGQILLKPCSKDAILIEEVNGEFKAVSYTEGNSNSEPLPFESLTLEKKKNTKAVYQVIPPDNESIDGVQDIPAHLLMSSRPSYSLFVAENQNLVFPREDVKCKDVTPGNNTPIDYILPAQLLLWREDQSDGKISSVVSRNEYKYYVSLIGVSGPATKALTALLVDDKQKWEIWKKSDSDSSKDLEEHFSRYLPLNTLQTHIRKIFFAKYRELLTSCDSNGAPLTAIDLCCTFLSTILPQYFLPFLSKSDEKRIYHALDAFLRTVDTSNIDGINDSITNYPLLQRLKKLLETFSGVEVLYQVEVSAQFDESADFKDERKIKNIELFNTNRVPVVINCLYKNPHNEKKEQYYGKETRTPGDDPGCHHSHGQ